MNDLKVAIVGTGGIYRLAHGPAWRQIPQARVIATCDIIKERADQARAELGVEKSFSSLEDLLARDSIDLVDICTPHPSHAELAIKALRAGKHVICEKPMALEIEDAARMMEVAKETGGHLYIGHTRRFDRRWVEIKQQLKSGRIGEPVAARWNERSWAGFPGDNWRWDPRNGGVLMDLGVHVADLFAWFFEAEATEVYAKTLSIRPEARRKGAADFALVQLTFAGNKQALMELSWAHPQEYAPFYSTLEIIGTRGKLTLSDRDAAPMVVIKDGTQMPRYSPLLSTFPESFVGELSHFVASAADNTEARITPANAYRAVAVMVKAQESAATGKPISIKGAN
ncbi:MAG TPA: Gfo/Idh/MocA family oxidoreductase [Candidatus Binatia bacterium]|nr:Gfo/Idh/MocA family oxidoreductase [Candidatus Binatia bacterium]